MDSLCVPVNPRVILKVLDYLFRFMDEKCIILHRVKFVYLVMTDEGGGWCYQLKSDDFSKGLEVRGGIGPCHCIDF